jgi:hypothetical protein
MKFYGSQEEYIYFLRIIQGTLSANAGFFQFFCTAVLDRAPNIKTAAKANIESVTIAHRNAANAAIEKMFL